jgi:SAM-dependent methyltransferase
MSEPRTSRSAAHRPAGPAPRQPAYSEHARSYERRTGAFQRHRDTIVGALPVSRGQVVLDVGCGTGLCYGPLQEKVGPQGRVVGIEESPEMAAVARERIAAEGWPNVTIVQSPAEDAKIPVTADAALFCAVHDILQSPDALQNIMSNLRPGAWVAAGGGKWAPWAMMALNLQVRTLHAPYVRSFSGFGRPWNHLEELIEDMHVREVAFGSGYIVTGQAPGPGAAVLAEAPGSSGQPGHGGKGAPGEAALRTGVSRPARAHTAVC